MYIHKGSTNTAQTSLTGVNDTAVPQPIVITYGYSRDHRPDLKQFILDLICSEDGDVPLFLRVGDGNESDQAVFPQVLRDFKKQIDLDALMVADSALYSEANLVEMATLKWLSRVPLTLKQAKELVSQLTEEAFTESAIAGYRWSQHQSQSSERGFSFLKHPLFFTDSVFLKSSERIEALALIMGLCLLVYTLAQRQLRQAFQQAHSGIKNQLGRLTQRPTLRWIFQCFQAIHLLQIDSVKRVSNLTDERLMTLGFFPATCQAYYLIH